jgi:hypothetical protein
VILSCLFFFRLVVHSPAINLEQNEGAQERKRAQGRKARAKEKSARKGEKRAKSAVPKKANGHRPVRGRRPEKNSFSHFSPGGVRPMVSHCLRFCREALVAKWFF